MEILKDKIVWQDPIQSDSSVTFLGTADKLFDDCEHLFIEKNVDKRFTLMFKHPTTGKTVSVVASDIVNKLYRSGQMNKAEALSLDVLQGKDMLDSRTDTMRQTFWLSLPAQGWTKVADVKVTPFTKAIDYNKFSTL